MQLNGEALAAELAQRAEEKFGKKRAEKLRANLQQMAQEIEALQSYKVEFDDEP